MELDLKDKKIISELDMNARISHSELGKKTRLSKQVVKYRIEKLEKLKIIQGYNAVIDIKSLGDTIYVIYFKLIRLSSAKEKEWIKRLNSSDEIIALGKNVGLWDLTVVVKCKDNFELDQILRKITQGIDDKIKERLITNEIESTYFSMGLLIKSKNMEVSTPVKNERIKLDDKDVLIIKELTKNCQTSLLDLSLKIKLTPHAVRNRIKRLEEKNVILFYKTKTNYDLLGFLHFRVFLHIKNFDTELYQKLKNFLKNKGNIESISRYVGYADVDFRCYTKTLIELYELIFEIKNNFLEQIIEVNSVPIFNWKKINYYPK